MRAKLSERYDNNLARWIDSLPLIEYDFQTRVGRLSEQLIKLYLDNIELGTEYMGSHYTNRILLNFTNNQELDNFIAQILPSMLSIEREVENFMVLK